LGVFQHRRRHLCSLLHLPRRVRRPRNRRRKFVASPRHRPPGQSRDLLCQLRRVASPTARRIRRLSAEQEPPRSNLELLRGDGQRQRGPLQGLQPRRAIRPAQHRRAPPSPRARTPGACRGVPEGQHEVQPGDRRRRRQDLPRLRQGVQVTKDDAVSPKDGSFRHQAVQVQVLRDDLRKAGWPPQPHSRPRQGPKLSLLSLRQAVCKTEPGTIIIKLSGL
jgi:hypothetical protein